MMKNAEGFIQGSRCHGRDPSLENPEHNSEYYRHTKLLDTATPNRSTPPHQTARHGHTKPLDTTSPHSKSKQV
jgi:hypothetical protein